MFVWWVETDNTHIKVLSVVYEALESWAMLTHRL